MAEKLSINQWAVEDRPREKMEQKGAAALSDAELLAILIGSGNRHESAVELMRRILADCNNNLNVLGKMPLQQLQAYKGIGLAKAITIQAACELGKRRKLAEVPQQTKVDSSNTIYELMHPRMQDLPHEECWVILLNTALKVIDTVCVSKGGLNATAVDVRCVLREALMKRATLIALCHNHPSGNAKPSADDDRLTTRLQKACAAVDIRLLDHVVIADGAYYSYQDEGRL